MRRTGHALTLAALSCGPAWAASTQWAGDARVSVRLVTAVDTVSPGDRIAAGLQFRLKPGWYTYWRTPGDAGIAPKLDWSGSQNLMAAAMAWPSPARHVTAGLHSNVYDRDVILPLTLNAANPGDPMRLRASVDFAGCADICVPYHADLSLDLRAGPSRASPEADLIAAARLRVPGDPAAAGLEIVATRRAKTPSGSVVTVLVRSRTGRFAAPEVFAEHGGEDAPAGLRLADDGRDAWLRIALSDAAPAAEAAAGSPSQTSPPWTSSPPGTSSAGTVVLTLVDGLRAAEWSVPATAHRD